VLGLRFDDVQVADPRLVIVAGKGGHHRVVPAANSFFDALGAYLRDERPANAITDRVFVVLKVRAAGSRSRPKGWTRSSTGPAAGPGWRTRHVTNSGTPV
jgi:site-specific recombinase XerD